MPEITTIITASCRKDNFRSQEEMLDCAQSILNNMPSAATRVIYVFDGADISEGAPLHGKCKSHCNRTEYLDSIRLFKSKITSIFEDVTVIVAPQRVCLTTCLQMGIQASKTNLLNILQADFKILKPVPIEEMCLILEERDEVELIRYPEETNEHEEKYSELVCPSQTPIRETRLFGNLFLSRCNLYSDMAHVATKHFYEEYIFPQVKKHDFMEHSLKCARYTLPEKLWYFGRYSDGKHFQHLDHRKMPPCETRPHEMPPHKRHGFRWSRLVCLVASLVVLLVFAKVFHFSKKVK